MFKDNCCPNVAWDCMFPTSEVYENYHMKIMRYCNGHQSCNNVAVARTYEIEMCAWNTDALVSDYVHIEYECVDAASKLLVSTFHVLLSRPLKCPLLKYLHNALHAYTQAA